MSKRAGCVAKSALVYACVIASCCAQAAAPAKPVPEHQKKLVAARTIQLDDALADRPGDSAPIVCLSRAGNFLAFALPSTVYVFAKGDGSVRRVDWDVPIRDVFAADRPDQFGVIAQDGAWRLDCVAATKTPIANPCSMEGLTSVLEISDRLHLAADKDGLSLWREGSLIASRPVNWLSQVSWCAANGLVTASCPDFLVNFETHILVLRVVEEQAGPILSEKHNLKVDITTSQIDALSEDRLLAVGLWDEIEWQILDTTGKRVAGHEEKDQIVMAKWLDEATAVIASGTQLQIVRLTPRGWTHGEVAATFDAKIEFAAIDTERRTLCAIAGKELRFFGWR